MERKNAKAKIIISVVVLMSTLAFAALGTFAWFSLSQRGELSGMTVSMDRDNLWPFQLIEQTASDSEVWVTTQDVWDAKGRGLTNKWKKSLTLSKVKYTDSTGTHEKDASDCYQLRPVSTSDLKTWYLPQYTKDGQVQGVIETPLEQLGNINRYTATVSEEGKDTPANYLYYYDLWVRTSSDENDYELHLGNPLNGENDLELASMTEEYNYGTYVLPGLVQQVGESVATLSSAGYDMSTCLRIGFAIYETNPDDITDATISEYWIYEPNCDTRAKYFTAYVASASSYETQKNNDYILADGGNNIKVGNHAEMADGVDKPTLLPHKLEGGGVTFSTASDVRTIKQLKSTWKNDIDLNDLPRGLDSTYIDHFGAFTCKYTNNPALDGIDTPPLTEEPFTNGTPVHIRVFVWMEGQDVDCWNSSLQGSLKIGLEFRGDAVSN